MQHYHIWVEPEYRSDILVQRRDCFRTRQAAHKAKVMHLLDYGFPHGIVLECRHGAECQYLLEQGLRGRGGRSVRHSMVILNRQEREERYDGEL